MSNDLTQLTQLLIGKDDASLQTLIARLSAPPTNDQPHIVETHGSWGSLPRFIAATLQNVLARPICYITAHIPQADKAQDDLETFIGRPVQLLPASESTTAQPDPTSDIACERLRLCQSLLSYNAQTAGVTVASIPALMQPVPAQTFMQENALPLTTDNAVPMKELLTWLTDHGFNRTEDVDLVGDFASRGGIVDIFPPDKSQPVRLEYFGDQIDSIRYFDIDTKRSIRAIDTIAITGCDNTANIAQATNLIEYLPKNTLIVIEELNEVIEVGRLVRTRLIEPESVYPVEEIMQAVHRFDTLAINRFNTGTTGTSHPFHTQSAQQYDNRSTEALEELAELAKREKKNIFLFCEKPAQRQRLQEILLTNETDPTDPTTPKKTIPKTFHFPIGLIHQGFALPDANALILSHHELFGQHHIQRRIRATRSTQAVESFTDLEINDLVVHMAHGIGKFKGLKTITREGRQEEYITIEYADNALIHVPANKIDLVHKYVGSSAGRVKLSKLGSKTWEKKKQKAIIAVEDMASHLIDVQAHRQTTPGIQYPIDGTWQNEFEQSFPYQPTDDQVAVSAEIKNDMQLTRPMDRLLCGDVGYGKTELAMRAVFKAIEHGKQVAVLVPTTILASQHYRTFTERMADFPFNIEVVSRFKTAKEAKLILEATAQGQVDVLIGTHRILSADVRFKDLGLIVIDEEQRFGVEHKEKLKTIRKTVDILTMTATPLPRTMHMALIGIRDISSLTTPPLDRRSIVTEVCQSNDPQIRQIILRELARGGQVFFLHNRVQSIQVVGDRLRRLIPEATFLVAHGQMPKRDLEKRMTDFVNHKADVLVSTTIIESGLDIPDANTIIIDDADRFGLAELHQLRGRVGRYKNRAYAYMLLPQKRTINPIAVKRLKAIEEYSQLGSGFRIAMRDLEIRGAGNILGIEQSGHIDAVGYELYCRLLASAVGRLNGEKEIAPLITHLELNITNNIPRSYINSSRQRMDVYRRMVTCRTAEDLDQLEQDLNDMFGKPPRSVTDLLQLAEIRILASNYSIRSIIQKEPDLIFNLSPNSKVKDLFANAPGSVRIPDPNTIHLRLTKRYFETPTTLMSTLRRFLEVK
ncbi:MAG: transcription-repair coupling factor [Phycisphaerae bacterium]|nr:transcription-repair coupling factor [Phycisphaerae bacterium]